MNKFYLFKFFILFSQILNFTNQLLLMCCFIYKVFYNILKPKNFEGAMIWYFQNHNNNLDFTMVFGKIAEMRK